MSIDTICGGCEKKLRVSEEHAGKKARCPHCGWVYEVPAPGSQPATGNQPTMGNQPTGDSVFGGSLPSGSAGNAAFGSAGSGSGDEWFLQTEDGQVYGPVPKTEMDGWVREGRVTARSRLRSGTGSTWVMASDVYAQLGQPAGGPVGAGGQPNPFAEQNPFAAPSDPAGATNFQPQGRTRRFREPHRGGTILGLGIAGILCCGFAAIGAWIMGQQDLNAMNQGRMDPSGRGMTQVGMILGIIGTILMGLGVLLQIFGAMADF